MPCFARVVFGLLALASLIAAPVPFFPKAWAQSNPSLTAYERGIDRGDGQTREESARLTIQSMKVDARVHGRTADDADIDLWVDEPNGERVYYSAKLSSSGGQ